MARSESELDHQTSPFMSGQLAVQKSKNKKHTNKRSSEKISSYGHLRREARRAKLSSQSWVLNHLTALVKNETALAFRVTKLPAGDNWSPKNIGFISVEWALFVPLRGGSVSWSGISRFITS